MRWGFLFISLFSNALWGQNYGGLSIDNDLFFGKDYYYSSGIFLEYGITKSNRDKPLDSQELFKTHVLVLNPIHAEVKQVIVHVLHNDDLGRYKM